MADQSASQSGRFEVIDSDGHVIEPDTVWSEYAEPEFRELLASGAGGYVQATGITRAYPDMPAEFLTGGGAGPDSDSSWDEIAEHTDWEAESKHKMSRPGGHDPVARLVDMDAEGIDVAVLYPTAMLTWIEEADIFGAACRAYNNWLHDYCAAAPERLFPVALVPLQDADAAITEMRRAVADLGAKAVMIRPASYLDGRKLNDPVYDRFWAAAAALDCPIGVHPSPHGDMANSCRLLGLADGVVDPTQGLALRQGLTNAFDLQMAVAYFVLGGICERHPGLRVAFLEGTGGWIVPMLQRFDHQFEIFGSSDQTMLPSEVFARQCMISFDPDEVALAFTAEHLGAEKLLWASDYPHPDAKIPGVVEELMEAVKSLPDESQRQIVGATARSFYRL
ncbi:MAG TPA: amidohydrolase family protein [Acidimicrobiia bacterium]|nr:amidohydrolase family protein [Acidimicrobiia bacterium]